MKNTSFPSFVFLLFSGASLLFTVTLNAEDLVRNPLEGALPDGVFLPAGVQTNSGSGSAVPEPGALSLLALAGVALAMRRAR